jgi:hypothetical protein
MEPTELLPDADLQMLLSLAGWQFPVDRKTGLCRDARFVQSPDGLTHRLNRNEIGSPTRLAFKLFLRETNV